MARPLGALQQSPSLLAESTLGGVLIARRIECS